MAIDEAKLNESGDQLGLYNESAECPATAGQPGFARFRRATQTPFNGCRKPVPDHERS